MIILFHGTGDDDSKSENWIPWVAKIMEQYGEKVLTVAGVESGQQGRVATNALDFLKRLGNKAQIREVTGTQLQGLCNALNKAGGDEMHWAAKVSHGHEENVIKALGKFHIERGVEDGAFAYGIKYRTAIAAICALAYYRRVPAAHLKPFRIIGHSRGGSTAVAVHNVLTYYGISCDHTLTLDPCHGVKKALVAGFAIGTVVPIVGNVIGYKIGKALGSQKDYYHKIWAGQLYNIPCVKTVGDSVFDITYRPPIEQGTGGNATITNHAILKKIKHGHMGKLTSLAGNETAKTRERIAKAIEIQAFVARHYTDANSHLIRFFAKYNNTSGADGQDRLLITNKVIETLTQ
jgi:hypothetical protein